MTEQENKIPTATEIEQQLRERRQKELEQAGRLRKKSLASQHCSLVLKNLKSHVKG